MKRYLNFATHGIKYLILRVTNRCNASCSFCLNNYYQAASANNAQELSVEEYSRIARNMKGLVLLNLSGGEPYLRPDLFEIADAFVVHSGAWLISSPTNGSFPERTVDFAERMLARHKNIVLKIGISIDGTCELHDQIRCVPSGYDKALETATQLNKLKSKYPNLMVHAITTVSAENSTAVGSIVDEISALKLFDEHFLTLVRGPGDENRATVEQFESYRSAYVRLMSSAVSESLKDRALLAIMKSMVLEIEKSYLEKSNSFICQAGKKMLNISEQGDVCICEMLVNPFLGNLREYDYDPKKIITLPASIERLKNVRQKGCNCHWDCAIYGSLLFGGVRGYRKILSNMYTGQGHHVRGNVNV